MSIIKFNNRRSDKQLQYLEILIERYGNPLFKITKMREIVGRPVSFITDLTKIEASMVIDWLKKEMGIL